MKKVLRERGRRESERRYLEESNYPISMSAYVTSRQDEREDRAMAHLTGMSLRAFKRSPQSKTIDRAIVSLNRANRHRRQRG